MLKSAGDEAVQILLQEVRKHMSALFKICEAIGMLDMVGYAQLNLNATLRLCLAVNLCTPSDYQ